MLKLEARNRFTSNQSNDIGDQAEAHLVTTLQLDLIQTRPNKTLFDIMEEPGLKTQTIKC
jgi:hypothetical protein